MSSLEEIRNARLKKLKLLRDRGINPYPIYSKQDFSLEKIIKDFSKLSKRKKPLSLVGRIMSLRPQGGLIFCSFNDGTAVFQALLKKGELENELFSLFKEAIDIGDLIEFKGTLLLTNRKDKPKKAAVDKIVDKMSEDEKAKLIALLEGGE